jgi:hypothetical protein
MLKLLATASLLATAAAANAAFMFDTKAPDQMVATAPGWSWDSLVTVGDTLPNGYRPVGILDGIGAYKLNDTTIRALVTHEIAGNRGYAYTLANGTSLTGARISYFDIDIKTKNIVDGGLAYDRIIGRDGADITVGGNGIQRLCSSSLYEANSFGPGRGLADRIYMAGEESANGTNFALDTSTNTLHAVPWMGRAQWENVAQVDTGTTDKVAFIIGDDTSGAPLYLYVGNKKAGGTFLERNGLADGKMYAWKSDAGDTGPSTFNGANGDSRSGEWVEVTVYDAAKAGMAGYDAQGFADQATLTAEAKAKGAMGFSRPEDVATNPEDGTLVALASTGSGFEGGADTWGTVYTIDLAFDANGNPLKTAVKIVYNGNQDASRALRSPDNLDWSGADTLLINEDRSADWASAIGANPNEASILELDMAGNVRQIFETDRSAVPMGQVDSNPGDFGNWESSGILDISELLGYERGAFFLADMQAHSVLLGNGDLVQGGQLAFIRSGTVPEAATWAMMIAGFGLVGIAARRRRSAAVAA